MLSILGFILADSRRSSNHWLRLWLPLGSSLEFQAGKNVEDTRLELVSASGTGR